MAGARMHHPAAQAHAVLMVAADRSIISFAVVATSAANVCEGGEAGAIEKPSAASWLDWDNNRTTPPIAFLGCFSSNSRIQFFGKMLQLHALGNSATGNIMLTLILLVYLVVVHGQDDPCIALQERMIDMRREVLQKDERTPLDRRHRLGPLFLEPRRCNKSEPRP